ncbi:MAG: SagB/ThcOx family dehydrogenase [Acidobacteriota bacterium]
MAAGAGDLFQTETRYFRSKPPGGYLDRPRRPAPYKTYPDAPRVRLSSPAEDGGMPIWEAIRRRRSERNFQNSPLSLPELSQLLWASQGVTKKFADFELRAAPSAGALYPVETYLSVQMVEAVDSGIYHYNVRRHELELVRSGDFRFQTAQAALDQGFMAEAALIFAWTAIFARSKWKYRERAYRYIYLDAGHIAQNVALAAVALGLGSCQVAALYDEEVNEVLGVDGKEESIIYMTAVGRL